MHHQTEHYDEEQYPTVPCEWCQVTVALTATLTATLTPESSNSAPRLTPAPYARAPYVWASRTSGNIRRLPAPAGGCMGVWVHGCVNIWVYGCMPFECQR